MPRKLKTLLSKIKSLKFKIGGLLGTIEGSTTNEDNEQNVCLSPNVYKLYHEQNDKFKNALLCEDHMSYYNPINIEIEKEFKEKKAALGKEIKDDLTHVTSKHKETLTEVLKRSKDQALEAWHKVKESA